MEELIIKLHFRYYKNIRITQKKTTQKLKMVIENFIIVFLYNYIFQYKAFSKSIAYLARAFLVSSLETSIF